MARTTRAEALADWTQKKMGYRRAPTTRDRDFQYELRKKALPQNLSPDEYQNALRKIAEELGI